MFGRIANKLKIFQGGLSEPVRSEEIEEPQDEAPPSNNWSVDISEAMSTLRIQGYGSIGLISYHVPDFLPQQVEALVEAGITHIVNLHPDDPMREIQPFEWVRYSDFEIGTASLDAFVNIDPIFDAPLHAVGMAPQISRVVKQRSLPLAFADIGCVFPHISEEAIAQRRASAVTYHYAAYSNLKGNFLEFGVWFGRNLFNHYHLLKDQLTNGKFYAFDSFGGLSKPTELELKYTRGDFAEGRYFCNEASFDAIRKQAGVPDGMVNRIPGFYDQSLRGKSAADYGIAPRSVSFCLIDCDLYDPTVDVLDFVYEALEDGALMYFDDLRLSRAANKSGEYDALRRWLKRHPEIGLVELPVEARDWRSAWYIFNRYTD